MPEVPRDPRQLARDILSGKVKIEDLARERQQRGGTLGGRQPQAQMPGQVPLPRPVPSLPQRPMQRPPLQRGPLPSQRQPQPQRMPPPQRQAPRAVVVPPPVQQRPQMTVAAPAEAYAQPPAPAAPSLPGELAAKVGRRSVRLFDLTRSRQAMRQGFLLAEVLNKPLWMRDESF